MSLPKPAPSLSGVCVLNPRPARQAAALSQALISAGANVLALPLLEIVPMALDVTAKQDRKSVV